MGADLGDDSPGADAPSDPGSIDDQATLRRDHTAVDLSVWPGRLMRDASLSQLEGGRVLVGGSPLTVLRFAGPIDLDEVASPAVIDRLVDTGMAHPVPSTSPFTPDDVSVVIPVFGHVQALSSTLAGLARMPVRTAQIVVVDDASPDADAVAATVALAGRRSTRLIRHARRSGPAAARNTGTEAVTTPLVAYVDAGCVPEPGWLEHLLAHFADPRVALVAPRVRAAATRWSDGDAESDGPADSDRPTDPYRPADLDRQDETRGEHRTADDDRTATGRRGNVRPVRAATPRDRRSRRTSGWLLCVRQAIARYETHRSSLDLGDRPARIAPRTRVAYVPAACVVARTAEVRRIDGFDEALRVGEDVDLVWRLGRDRRLRYEPAGTASHDVRTSPRRWLARRFAYGTSAAPLARRHPRGPVPVSVSGWSAAAWAGVAAGRPLIGAAIAATSTALLVRKLSNLEHPVQLAVKLAGVGNLAAGGLLANALRRVWWPIAVTATLFGPKPLRRTIVAAYLVPPLLEWRPATGIDPLTWLVLCTADDVAYGAGVWAGCFIERTVEPLLPDLSAGRVE